MENLMAWIDEKNSVTIEYKEIEQIHLRNMKITVEGQTLSIVTIDTDNGAAKITLDKSLSLGKQAYLEWGRQRTPIYPRKIVRTAWFDQVYDASNEKLGSYYTPEKTTFSVWAPTATNVDLLLLDDRISMGRKSNGVWHTIVAGDWQNSPYHFAVTVNGNERLVNDPYAKSMTANSARSVVIDLESTDPTGFRTVDYPSVDKKDAIIYELHIRDATSAVASGVKHRGKFLGLTETSTRNQAGYSTGLSYIKELGCTHVELLPVNDYARVDELNPEQGYNWGYDPLFYFVPEGSYVTDANNPFLRVHECKQMIQAFHQQGLSVILDVVYNHVFYHPDSAFEKIVPGYYFRYRDDGSMSNGSGTGNDIATERKMVRSFILDCVDYWIEQYTVDGFRFDLMGAMDLETMQAIQRLCRQKAKPIVLLGEGWELATELLPEQKATMSKSEQLQDISFFNDMFRDTVKGNLFSTEDRGFINGEGRYHERLAQLVSGSCHQRFNDPIYLKPEQSINYVECHDNHTLIDRLRVTNPYASEQERKWMHQLATGLTLLSQGVPFLHAGQEFFRTKQGDGNSYISGDAVNQLDWEQRGEEESNIQWVRNLITLRKTHRLFRIDSAREIEHRLHIIFAPPPVFGYMLMGQDEDVVIFVNPTAHVKYVEMPAHGRWEKLISNHSPSVSSISCLIHMETAIGAYELGVWRKKRV